MAANTNQDQPVAPVIRAGSQRAECYNDGLLVFLYDRSFREALKAENAAQKLNDALFQSKNGKEDKSFLTARRVVGYELQQDDEVCVDVAVGAPLEKNELAFVKGVKWKSPQTTLISLPTGNLVIESGNSCRIGEEPEENLEQGAELTVPPGDYVLTLYRIDWEATDDELMEKIGRVGEFITLMPIAEAKAPKTFSAVLPWPVKKPKTSWVGAYEIDGSTFKGQAIFADHWEFMSLNLDRAAGEKLGLSFGTLLEVIVGQRRFVIAYLGNAIKYGIPQVATYKSILGKDRMTQAIANEPELAYGLYFNAPEAGEIMTCMRINAKEAWPKGKDKKWLKMTGRVLPEKLAPIDREDLGKWTQSGNTINGKVLLLNDRYLSINLNSQALEAVNVRPGDKLAVSVGGVEQTALLCSNLQEMAQCIQKSEPQGAVREAYMAERVKLYSVQGAEADAVREKIRQMLKTDPPLVAAIDAHWYEPDQQILLVTPMSPSKESIGVVSKLDYPAKAGDAVTVRKV